MWTRIPLKFWRIRLGCLTGCGRGGVGDAVLEALAKERVEVHKLAISEIPHSGKPAELLDRYGISAAHIVHTAKESV